MEAMIRRSRRAKLRFRALVRHVIANAVWLTETKENVLEMTSRIYYAVSKATRAPSALELKNIALLNKKADERTEAEKISLYKAIGGFRCFRRYPEHVKMLLAGCTYFAYFGPDRVIVRQGHVPHALYFIIKGGVSASLTTWDPVTKKYETKVMSTLTAGDVFGEASLIHNIPRTYTITTMTPTEFLILYRHDFNIILKDTLMAQWERNRAAMDMFTYFDSWDVIQKKECAMVAKIKVFRKDETILGDRQGDSSSVHFVLRGRCRLIEHIFIGESREKFKRFKDTEQTVTKEKNEPRVTFDHKTGFTGIVSKTNLSWRVSRVGASLARITSVKSFGPPINDVRFMQVCIFSAKSCFGLGESMERRRIVAMNEVKCLIIPLHWFEDPALGTVWARIRRHIQRTIPTTQDLQFELREQTKWRKYKKDLMKKMIKKQPCNCPQNIPYSIRIEQDFDYVV